MGVVPIVVAGAQEDEALRARHTASGVFWRAAEADARFVTRSGGEQRSSDDELALELTADLSGEDELDSDASSPAPVTSTARATP